jgi:WD40 repeat protein
VFFDKGEVRSVGKHAGPVKAVVWCPVANCLLSGSWDRTLKLWRRAASGTEHTLVKTIKATERVCGADVVGNIAVVVVAGVASKVLVYRVDTAEDASLEFERDHPLKFQVRSNGVAWQ